MTRFKTYQDPLYGAIQFPGSGENGLDNLMKLLIDSPEVQRLRHIRQNGLASLVFHGMEHSRFSHSIGVAYIARRMFDRILLNNGGNSTVRERKNEAVAAALLHDVGHGPFSHTLEEVLKYISSSFSHEKMTVRIIRESTTKVNKVLTDIDSTLPEKILPYIDKELRPQEGAPWSYKLVSSQIDADRLDYVLRDAMMAGLVGTTYDISRILNHLHVHPEQPDRLAISRHAIEAVESYLLALDQLYRAVYYHQAVRSATVLLKSILRRAVDLYQDGSRDVFPNSIGGNPHPLKLLIEREENVDLDVYIRLTDDLVWALIDQWQDYPDLILQDLCHRLWNRKLFKTKIIQDSAQGGMLKDKALELVEKHIPHIDFNSKAKYYVMIDVSRRRTYKPEDAIWLFDKGLPQTLQDDESSRIITVVREQNQVEYLMFPQEIQQEMSD